MILISKQKTKVLNLVVVLLITLLVGCSVKAIKNIWGDPSTGLILTYRMPDNEVLNYELSSKNLQTVEMMSQSMETTILSTTKFSAQSKGLKEKNLVLGITFDAIKINIKSMRGNFSPDTSSIPGKKFDLVLSPLGKEVDLVGAESIKFMTPSGERNASSFFKTIFPDLAERPVKIGDSWNSKDDFNEKTSNIDLHMIIDSVHTLEGLETVNSLDCVKVKTTGTGTMKGKGNQGGMDFTFEGKIKGTSTWYFAYKKGMFVKITGESSTDSTAVLSNGMSIPVSSESKTEINLVK